ncbi:hypothetical protein ATANTOWER_003556, partial [Ataeniobius toweri]|nr:hypothetical protein [Ataeniobius toweri]
CLLCVCSISSLITLAVAQLMCITTDLQTSTSQRLRHREPNAHGKLPTSVCRHFTDTQAMLTPLEAPQKMKNNAQRTRRSSADVGGSVKTLTAAHLSALRDLLLDKKTT